MKPYVIKYPPSNENIWVQLINEPEKYAISATNYYKYGNGGMILRDALSSSHRASWWQIRQWLDTEEGQEILSEAILLEITEDISDRVKDD